MDNEFGKKIFGSNGILISFDEVTEFLEMLKFAQKKLISKFQIGSNDR
jgi:hypothetical protein